MPEVLSRLLQPIKELWQNLDKSQKNRIYITSAILLVAVTIGIVMLTRPSYMTLIRNADTKEVGEMTKILDEKKIWNRIESEGGSIVINVKDNSKAQAALIQGGYPKSNGMTFDDAFKMIKINTTENDKKKLWEQYKASSLSAKLKMLDNVEYADVTLSMPEPSPFVTSDQENQKPSANVVVKPKGELTQKQVQGIVMMVASSVENLNPKDVNVVDNNLNILNAEQNEESGSTGTQYEMKLKVKKELEKNVRDIFNGPFDNFDSIRVVANPILDFNKLRMQTNDIQNPTGMTEGAVISSEKVKEKLENSGGNGEPGVESNPGTATTPSYPISGNGNSNYDKQSEKLNKDYKKIQTEEEKALGAMDTEKSSMTVTLLYGKRVTDDAKLTPEFIEQFKKDVSGATGISVAKISVNKYKVAPAEVVEKKAADIAKELMNTYGFFALMLFLVIGLMIAAMPRKKREPKQELEVAAASAVHGPRFIAPDASMESLPEIGVEEKSEIKKQIDKFVKDRPEAVAQLLRNWLSDEWD